MLIIIYKNMEGVEQTTEKILGHEGKIKNAQEILIPMYREYLSPENVLNYMFEKNKYGFEGFENRK